MILSDEEIAKELARAEEKFKNKQYNDAVLAVRKLIKICPENATVYRKLGLMLMHSPSQDQALDALKKAISLASDDADNWIAMGMFYKKQNVLREALTAFKKALQLRGDDTEIYREIFFVYRLLGNYPLALTISEKLIEMEPGNSLYHWMHAQALVKAGKEILAHPIYDKLVKNKWQELPRVAMEEWLELSANYGYEKEANRWLKEIYIKYPDNTQIAAIYAVSCQLNHNNETAIAVMQKVHQNEPENSALLYQLAAMYGEMGNIDKAVEYYSRVIMLNPLNTQAHLNRGLFHTYRYGDPFFKELNIASTHYDRYAVEHRTQLHYALGKAYDDVGEYSTAFEHYKIGGALNAQGKDLLEYEQQKYLLTFLSSKLTKEMIAASHGKSCQSTKPVFIVGMPRSGTTLIEQTLSCIKGVYGVGELTYMQSVLNNIEIAGEHIKLVNLNSSGIESADYRTRGCRYVDMIERLVPPDAIRIIDKMPGNFIFAGLIHMLLPNASIIHAQRHPVEVCLSAYRLRFQNAQHWSDDLKTMGKYYRLYAEMMDHWKKVLPEGAILDVKYENMVHDLEGSSKRLSAHIGVKWSPACMEYHKSTKVVRTASLAQVRQPIYRSSVNRWRKYEPYLQPLLDEIGDLVEAYETELATDNGI